MQSRTPRWVRGLKYPRMQTHRGRIRSHPTMGAWIEIGRVDRSDFQPARSHPTMGAWIEIEEVSDEDVKELRRTPRWVRGLK